MDNTVLLLPHQERFLQSPRNFPDIRWHFLLAGYGAGKTRSLAIAALSLISELDGEKDDGGLYAKIAVAGYTYAHLEQTFLIDFRAYLEASKTPYHEDTKDHIITVGTVQLILLQLSEPGKIFGQSIHAALCVDGGAYVLLERGHVPLSEVAVGDMIMTKDGWHRVTAVRCSGYRPCIMTNGVYTTLNHPFIVNGGEIKMAQDLTPDDMVELPNGTMLRVLQDRTLVEREVYDITVDAVHEYYAGGLRVKNCDEIDELEEDIMIEAMKSVSQRVRQIMPGHRSPFVMAASTAQGMKGFYRLYSHYKKCGVGFVLVRARTQDNWYLPREYIEDLWKNFTETERKVYMEGEFLTVTQGRVIPNFDWDRNFAPESDMDLHLLPGERVFIGQDFNCLRGDTRILTINGEVPIKDIREGDYVLTRKGFRKVLTAVSRGVKVVSRYNVLFGTKDHVAITPEGDKQLCDATNFYCLPERCISDYAKLGIVMERLAELRTLLTTDSCGTGTLTSGTETSGTTSLPEEEWRNFIDMSIGSFMGRFRNVGTCTTKMGSMITGLRALSASRWRSITESIRLCAMLPRLLSTRLLIGTIVRRRLRDCGIVDASAVRFVAWFVERLLRQKSIRRSIVLSARKPCGGSASMTRSSAARQADRLVIEAVLKFVSSVEQKLEELLRRDIARSIKVIGNDRGGQEEEAEVYDIEVEGEHEFFANGVLVHNCGYSRASAWVSRDGCLHCVKYYDFPDVGDAPRVFRYDFPEQDLFWVPDVTSKDQYPHFARDLRKYDVHIIHRAKSPMVEDSCFLLSKLCLQGRLMIHSQASEVADAFATASRDKNNRIPKGVGASSPIHAIDGARYACSYMALILPEYRDLRQGLMRHLASFRRSLEEDRDAPVRDKGAGYVQIEGTAFL